MGVKVLSFSVSLLNLHLAVPDLGGCSPGLLADVAGQQTHNVITLGEIQAGLSSYGCKDSKTCDVITWGEMQAGLNFNGCLSRIAKMPTNVIVSCLLYIKSGRSFPIQSSFNCSSELLEKYPNGAAGGASGGGQQKPPSASAATAPPPAASAMAVEAIQSARKSMHGNHGRQSSYGGAGSGGATFGAQYEGSAYGWGQWPQWGQWGRSKLSQIKKTINENLQPQLPQPPPQQQLEQEQEQQRQQEHQ
eukprot:scaffold74162_cov19-Tisochrysis_lutea.AAC.3